jgi:hypothetical protein
MYCVRVEHGGGGVSIDVSETVARDSNFTGAELNRIVSVSPIRGGDDKAVRISSLE